MMPPETMAPPAPPMAPGAGMPMVPPRTPSFGPTGPASVNVKNEGQRLQGLVQANLAVKVLEGAIKLVGATSPEGQSILKALTILSKHFVQPSSDISKSEVKLMGSQVPAVPQAPAGAQGNFLEKLKSLGMNRPAAAPAASA